MALSTPTALDQKFGTAVGTLTNVVSNSVSPSSDSLLLACIGFLGGADNTVSSMATTLSNVGSWSTAVAFHGAVGAGFLNTTIMWAKVTGAPGTGTVTANFTGGTGYAASISVIEFASGYATSPIGATGSNSSNAANITVTLSGSPDAASTVLGFMFSESANNVDTDWTPFTGYTELQDAFNWFAAIGGAQEIETEYKAGSAGSTIDFTRIATALLAAVAVEILEAPTFVRPTVAVPRAAVNRAGSW